MRIGGALKIFQLPPLVLAYLAMVISMASAHAASPHAPIRITAGTEWHEPTVDMAFMAVPGGCYPMGTPDGTTPFWRAFGVTEIETEDERPVHDVCVDDFWLGKYEVTVAQYLRFVTATNSHFPAWLAPGGEDNLRTGKNDEYRKLEPAVEAPNNPIIGVSWQDAVAFTTWLSKTSGHTYRLPTEAEWEYACRSGGKQERHAGSSQHKYEDLGWDTNSGGMPRRVGIKAPNGLGLYDMSGNVNEFTVDAFRKDGYRYHGRDNPTYVGTEEDRRVIRGGSWFDGRSGNLRCAQRRSYHPHTRGADVGFRVLRTIDAAKNAK